MTSVVYAMQSFGSCKGIISMQIVIMGLSKGRSTPTNLLVTLECWTRILEEGSGLDVIYLDHG